MCLLTVRAQDWLGMLILPFRSFLVTSSTVGTWQYICQDLNIKTIFLQPPQLAIILKSNP